MPYDLLTYAHDEAKATRLTSAHCLYGAKCPLKLRCCFKHSQKEIAYFNWYLDWPGGQQSCFDCNEPHCLYYKECICNDIDHPHWVGNVYSDSDSESDAENYIQDSTHDTSDPNEISAGYSSADDAWDQKYMDLDTWASSQGDIIHNQDLWATAHSGNSSDLCFKTDDGMLHCVPDLRYIGNGYIETADRAGYPYYVDLSDFNSTYIDPREDGDEAEAYPAPCVVHR